MGGSTASSSASSSGNGSLFRVGESIGLTYVLLFLSALVVFVVVLEQLLHKLEHSARKSRKHEEMLRKVYRELMILGFIGVLIKIFKEMTHISAYSDAIVAFQVADLTIFIVAVALILQALCVFLALRHKNFELDRVELVRTSDLADAVVRRQRDKNRPGTRGWLSWLVIRRAHACTPGAQASIVASTDNDLDDLVQLRILRHLFLRRYGLPELFPFSKYVRQAQDNQITHMIDVEISMWLLLLGVAWAIDGLAVFFRHGNGGSEPHALLLALSVFSWALLALHVAVMLYFRLCIRRLLNAGGCTQRTDAATCLATIAEDEDAVLAAESATDALDAMQEVQERQHARRRREKSRRRRTKRHCLVEQDTGLQLLEMAARQVLSWCSSKQASKPSDADSNGFSTTTTSIDSVDVDLVDIVGADSQGHAQRHLQRRRSVLLSTDIGGFSRKAWHFVIMVLLMLNAFYLAEFCQCVLYQSGAFSSQPVHIRVLIVVGLPVPMLLNMAVFQPRILRHFLIVSSILRVDVDTLSDVVTHFSEIVELRAEFAETLRECLREAGASAGDLERSLQAKDRSRTAYCTGVLPLEQLRLVLSGFGFRLSHFRFNSVAKLLFRLRESTVEYAQVLRMLALVEPPGDSVEVATVSAAGNHHHYHHGYHPPGHLLLRQSVLFEEGVVPSQEQDAAAHVLAINSTTDSNSIITRAGGLHEPTAAAAMPAIAARRHVLPRRQSSFQNTSVRALQALYHLDSINSDDLARRPSGEETHYVRM